MMLLLIVMLQVAPTATACVDSQVLSAGEAAECSGWLVSPLRIQALMGKLDTCRSDLEAAVEREAAFEAHGSALRDALAPPLAEALSLGRAMLRSNLRASTARPKRAFYDRPWVWSLMGAAAGIGGYRLYRWVRE